MPRSLSGRIVLVVVLPLLAAWLVMGVSMAVVLTGMHQDATRAKLADVGQTLIVRFRTVALDRELRAIIGEVREAVAGGGIALHLLRADGGYVDLDDPATTAVPVAPISIRDGAVRGETVTGSIEFTDGDVHLYAATVLRAQGVAGPRAIVLSEPDRSRAAALRDLVTVLPLVLLGTAIVGLPLVGLLARSVGGPLRRLALATADLPHGEPHRPLPLEGPEEVRELTDRFNAMAEELESARRGEAALLADLRHDLRTPLTVITGYAAALADGTAQGDEATRAARTIGDEAARLERLVDELGAVERLRRGADGLRPEPIDALDLLRSSAERFRATAASTGIALTIVNDKPTGAPDPAAAAADPAAANPAASTAPTAPAGPLPNFVADRGAVERILANLISNALAAAPSPGGHIWLAVAAGSTSGADGAPLAPSGGETVILSVTDDGPGFPPGAAARAFERFYRADPARSGAGSGLGLAIVREFALAHGGSAHAENVAPRGARVSVVLPRIPSTR